MRISASMKKGRTRSNREGLLRVREPSNRIGGETSALGRVDQFAMPSAKDRNLRKRDMAQSGWCRREAAIAGRENEVAIGRTPSHFDAGTGTAIYGKSCRSGRGLRPFTSDRVAAASASRSFACEFIGVRELQAGSFTVNGGGESADRQPAAANSAGTARGPNMLMRNAGFIRFMVGRAE
jgi:hypothetical protein